MGDGGPNRGGGRRVGKHPIYEGLDAPASNDWLTLSSNGTGSGLGGTLSASERSKHADANKKNPQWPPIQYTHFIRLVAMNYYTHRTMDLLEHNYLNGGM
jgi:hypothetical protein